MLSQMLLQVLGLIGLLGRNMRSPSRDVVRDERRDDCKDKLKQSYHWRALVQCSTNKEKKKNY